MAQTVKLKRSAVSGNTPTTSDLALGEIAINTYDGNIFIKKNDGTESIVTFSPGSNAGTIEEDSFSGNGSTTAFTLSSAPSSEEHLLVFIDATFQNRDSFTISGTTITFDTAPDNGSSVRVYHVIPGSVDDGVLTVAKFAADTLVLESEGISSNDNDTTIPTSAAVKDYVDTQVATVDTLPEVLANGNTTGGTNIAVSTGDDITFADSSKAIFGTGSDLEIFHNGTSSYIRDVGDGDLQLFATDDVYIRGYATNNYMARFNENGAVTLYHNNSPKFATTADGISVTSEVEADEFIGDLRGAVLFKAQAGEALAKGDVVYISGISGNTTVVSKADADDASKMPAFGIAAAAANANASVDIYTGGILGSLDTSSYSEGDELYVSTTAGTLTATAPTGETALLQKIAKVTRSDASAGSIFIIGAGRTNAVPNLDQDQFFLGNASNQAVATDFSDAVEALSINNVVEDTTPQLGGNLDLNSSDITGTGNINNTGTITTDGLTVDGTIDVNGNNIIDVSQIDGVGGTGWLDFNMDADNVYPASTTDNQTVLGSVTHMNFVSDSNANGTGGNFYWGYGVNSSDSGTFTETMELDRSGNLTVAGTIDSGAITSTGEVEATALDINGNGDISGNLTLGGYLAGPATFTIDPAAVGDNTGTVVIAGNLQVDGTTTTINSTTLTVDDKNITLASGSINAAAADGAGIEVDITGSTNPSILYDGTNDQWDFNKDIDVTGTVTADGLTVDGDATISDSTNPTFTITDTTTPTSLVLTAGNLSTTIGTTTDHRLKFDTNNIERLRIENNGDISFFNSAGTTEKLFWDASAERLGIGTNSPQTELEISAAQSPFLRLTSEKDGTHDAGDIYGELQFYTQETYGNAPVVAAKIQSLHTRAGTGHNNADAGLAFFTSLATNDATATERMRIESATGNVGIGTTSPATILNVYTDAGRDFKVDHGTANRTILSTDRGMIVKAGAGYSLDLDSGSTNGTIRFLDNGTAHSVFDASGKLGVNNTSPSAVFQVEEYGIDTTETSTTATTQVAIHTMSATTFRSARFTVQVTNSTDSTYHLTEILMIHDGTTPSITEYGTIFTGSAEATFDADISSGNVRLLATPATTDTMEFKVVAHSITT